MFKQDIWISLLGGIFTSVIAIFLVMASTIQTANMFIDKELLHEKLSKAIENGAHLDDVKQIFENRDNLDKSIFLMALNKAFGIKSETGDYKYYKEPVVLSTVLKDIKSNLYINGPVDEELVNSIIRVIDENERINPFDKLETGQKVHFEFIQSKLGKDYINIQNNINSVIDELDNKNQLVNKYFSQATLSFRLSILALIIGLIALIPQIISFWSWLKNKA